MRINPFRLHRSRFQALVIVAAALWVYWPSLHGDWLWDDEGLVAGNPIVRDAAGLWKIWFQPGSLIDYQPVKVTIEWIEWRLWGNDTLGYHATNVVLHIINALLLWRLLGKFGLRLAWLGGLIFAIHPLAVESVAWIAELKNTLSLPPFLLAMCLYLDYDEQGRQRDYFSALGLFLIAMLCKSTMVMFPAVILLYAWWKRGRIDWKDLKASAPFFAVSLALGGVTLWFLQKHALGGESIPLGGFFSRLALAGLSLSFYLAKFFLPVGLLPVYPQWPVDPPSLVQFLPWPILIGVIYGLWTKRAGWGRHALLGLGFFLINLAPFAGFTAGSYMAFTWVMDHILYIPMIGLIGLVVAGLGRIDEALPASSRPLSIGLLSIIMALPAWGSHSYARMFVNQETLWTYTLARNPEAYPGYNNLGNVLMKEGRSAEAADLYRQVLRIKPDYAEAHYNLGNALLKEGRSAEAAGEYEQALRINPDYAQAHNNLGVILLHEGRDAEAIEQDEQALRLNPDDAAAHYNLGDALLKKERYAEAIEQFVQALRTQPDYAEAHDDLGQALLNEGRDAEAVEQYEQALRIKPDYAEAHLHLGNALLNEGRNAKAVEQYEQALRIKPDYAEAHNNLGVVLAGMKRIPEAIAQFKAALQINPAYSAAGDNLKKVEALQKTIPAKK